MNLSACKHIKIGSNIVVLFKKKLKDSYNLKKKQGCLYNRSNSQLWNFLYNKYKRLYIRGTGRVLEIKHQILVVGFL